MKTQEFDFNLPKDLIAQEPLPSRDASRLLVLNRLTGSIQHQTFSALPDHICEGDLLIVNRSRVLPARLFGNTRGGGRAEVLYLFPEPANPDEFRALVRPGRKLGVGAVVTLAEGHACRVIGVHADGSRTVRFEGESRILDILQTLGHLPLPPYITRADTPLDRERYQTIYAKEPGSVAAPTAGLHFTQAIMDQLRKQGVLVGEILLHVGPGTFARVDSDDIAEHRVLPEHFEVPEETAHLYATVRARGGRVIAVGTTTVRTLESAISNNQRELTIGPGKTDLVIRPGHKFQAIDALVTNFHLPKSSLLFLASAFAGREKLLHAYDEAIRQKYRFYSYGDAMLIQ